MTSQDTSLKKTSKTCVICGQASVEAYQPFCSKRCADVDLARWFSGHYVIAGRPLDALEETIDDNFDENGLPLKPDTDQDN